MWLEKGKNEAQLVLLALDHPNISHTIEPHNPITRSTTPFNHCNSPFDQIYESSIEISSPTLTINTDNMPLSTPAIPTMVSILQSSPSQFAILQANPVYYAVLGENPPKTQLAIEWTLWQSFGKYHGSMSIPANKKSVIGQPWIWELLTPISHHSSLPQPSQSTIPPNQSIIRYTT